jgi:hypothetical protein
MRQVFEFKAFSADTETIILVKHEQNKNLFLVDFRPLHSFYSEEFLKNYTKMLKKKNV